MGKKRRRKNKNRERERERERKSRVTRWERRAWRGRDESCFRVHNAISDTMMDSIFDRNTFDSMATILSSGTDTPYERNLEIETQLLIFVSNSRSGIISRRSTRVSN